MEGSFSLSVRGDMAWACKAPRGAAATDGYDQGLADLVRGAQIALGVALPGGGTACEFGPALYQGSRRGEKLGPRDPDSKAGLGF